MDCLYCLAEGIHVEMQEVDVGYGRKIPAPTYDTEPDQELEYIEYWCPSCGEKERIYFNEPEE